MREGRLKGYIAISSVLVISVIVVVIGVSVSLLSISEAQTSLGGKKGEDALNLADSCVEEALIRISEDNFLPSSLSSPQGSCDIGINSSGGGDWDFTVTADYETYQKKIRVTAQRGAEVSLISWKEVN